MLLEWTVIFKRTQPTIPENACIQISLPSRGAVWKFSENIELAFLHIYIYYTNIYVCLCVRLFVYMSIAFYFCIGIAIMRDLTLIIGRKCQLPNLLATLENWNNYRLTFREWADDNFTSRPAGCFLWSCYPGI